MEKAKDILFQGKRRKLERELEGNEKGGNEKKGA